MKIYRTIAAGRMSLGFDRFGITVAYERPKVGGGFYVKNYQSFPWPWVEVD